MGEYADLEVERTCMAFGDWAFGDFANEPYVHRDPPFYPTDRDGRPNVYCAKCGIAAICVDGFHIYRREDLRNKMFWACRICGDRVGCHPHTNEPLGYLADAPTRAARSLAHARFDAIWRRGRMSRTDAYRWLSGCMGLDMSVCHIGMMDVDQLNEVVRHVHARFPEFTPKLDNIANFKF